MAEDKHTGQMTTVSRWLCHTASTFSGLLMNKLADLEQNLSQEQSDHLSGLENTELLH